MANGLVSPDPKFDSVSPVLNCPASEAEHHISLCALPEAADLTEVICFDTFNRLRNEVNQIMTATENAWWEVDCFLR